MPAFPNFAPTALIWSLADHDDLPGVDDGCDEPAAPDARELPADLDGEDPAPAGALARAAAGVQVARSPR